MFSSHHTLLLLSSPKDGVCMSERIAVLCSRLSCHFPTEPRVVTLTRQRSGFSLGASGLTPALK